MDYARFERLIVGVGAAAIVASAALSLVPGPDVVELIAQLLLLSVLVGAVQWGRRGGTVAAVASIVVYAVMRVPVIASGGLTADMVRLIALRAVSYGLLGIVGGEACTRIKYALARAQDSCAIDESTRLYTPRYLGRLLEMSIASYRRYGVKFSVIVIALSETALGGATHTKPGARVRAIAVQIRSDLRLVDEVGRLPAGAFVAILPQTTLQGADIVAARLRGMLGEYFDIGEGDIDMRVLSALDHIEAIQALADQSISDAD
jgi:GGDEF domain-containing protein